MLKGSDVEFEGLSGDSLKSTQFVIADSKSTIVCYLEKTYVSKHICSISEETKATAQILAKKLI